MHVLAFIKCLYLLHSLFYVDYTVYPSSLSSPAHISYSGKYIKPHAVMIFKDNDRQLFNYLSKYTQTSVHTMTTYDDRKCNL